MDASWATIKEEYDRLFDECKETGDPSKMLKALQLVRDYYLAHPDCLEAGYYVAYSHWGAMLYEWSFADSETAKRILAKIHLQGYSDAAYLLGKIYLFENKDRDGFLWMKKSVDDEPGTKDVLELAKCYSQGIGTTSDFSEAEALFTRLLPEQEKNADFLCAYADHLKRWKKPDCIKWYVRLYNNPIDIWDKIAALSGMVDASLDFDRLDDAVRTSEKLGRLVNECEDEESRSIAKESYINSLNAIELYKAKKAGAEDSKKFMELLNNGVDAILNSQASLAKKYLNSAVELEPNDRLTQLFYHIASVMEYNRDMEEEAVRQLVAIAEKATPQVVAASSNYRNMFPICSKVGRAVSKLALYVFNMLNDTYREMIDNQATFTGTAFRNYSAVGYGNKVYYPSLHRIATALYGLGDNLKGSFGEAANDGASVAWEIGNLLMKAYKNNAGMLEKINISSTISTYEGKIKEAKG